MRNKLTDNQLARLPKYAQDYIKELRGEAKTATENLDAWAAKQTPTKIWTTEYTSDYYIHRYFKADNIEIEHKGVRLRISGLWDEKEDIQLSWTPAGRGFPTGVIGLIPTSLQQAKLVNLAFNATELKQLTNLKENGEKNER